MHSLVPRPSITTNRVEDQPRTSSPGSLPLYSRTRKEEMSLWTRLVEGLVRLLLRMMSGGHYTEHKLENKNREGLGTRLWLCLMPQLAAS